MKLEGIDTFKPQQATHLPSHAALEARNQSPVILKYLQWGYLFPKADVLPSGEVEEAHTCLWPVSFLCVSMCMQLLVECELSMNMLCFCSWRLLNHGLSSDYHPGLFSIALPSHLLSGQSLWHSYQLIHLWSVHASHDRRSCQGCRCNDVGE